MICSCYEIRGIFMISLRSSFPSSLTASVSEAVGIMIGVGSRSVRFAETARVLGDAARREGLVVPSFRSPPRVLGRDRTIRRRADGSVSVAVALGGRPFAAVVADMIEGTVAANRLTDGGADQVRRRLWIAIGDGADVLGDPVSDAA
jgi:hypothetical protein